LKNFIKYFLLLYVVAISGFEYFFRVGLPATYFLFPFALLFFIVFKLKPDLFVIKIIVPFFIVFLLQHWFYHAPVNYAIALVIRLLTFYLVAKIIGKEFLIIFINIMKIIAIVSIFIYVILYIPSINELLLSFSKRFTNLGSNLDLYPDKPNFIIYCFQIKMKESLMFYRNSGPFFEPGAYVLFLNIALFLNIYFKNKLFNFTNILLIVNIVSAFSTMGLTALMLIVLFYSMSLKSIKLFHRIFIIIVLVVSIPVVSSLPFMNEKIATQISAVDISYSRFGAALVHWNIIKDYPITGLPYDDKTYSNYADDISPNGITEIFVRYGAIAGIIYYIFLFRASSTIMYTLNYKKHGFFLFMILFIVIFSETLGNKPFYWTLIFSQIPFSNYLKNKKISVQKNKNIRKDKINGSLSK